MTLLVLGLRTKEKNDTSCLEGWSVEEDFS